MSINWEAFFEIESRMAKQHDNADNNNTSIDLLQQRLAHVQIEQTPEDCHKRLLTVNEVKQFIAEQQKFAPFNDIPNLPEIDYSDEELELWAALMAEYRQVAEAVPTYTQVMLWSGIPPALRGQTWISMCEGHSQTFESLYDSLAAEWTPFVKIIGRDLNRTFPEIGLFQDQAGEGQRKLGRVLRAYSAYDMQVGYCQGLTFLAGPLLLHMSDREAFCVLVKLMEDYNVRSMFTADMSGLQLRMFQFESLLAKHQPELNQHFENLGVNSIYASQWFLSFFAVTCPLAMLVRIYDLMFAEGAIPTLFRVALAVLKRNSKVLMAFEDDEEVLSHLLGRQLWDAYGRDADLLVSDITMIGADTLSCLDELEREYKQDTQLSRARSRRRTKSIKKQKQNPGVGVGLASRMPTFSLWGSKTELARSNSKTSIDTAGSESDFTAVDQVSSGASSVTSLDTTFLADSKSMDYNKQLQEMQAQLERAKLALDSERRARQADKEAVEELIGCLPADQHDQHEASLSLVKAQFGISNDSPHHLQNSSSCNSCERYLMELAAAKTSDAVARQEIDELKDQLHKDSSPKRTAGWKMW